MSLLKTNDPLELALHRVEGKAEIINGKIVHLGLAGAMPGAAADSILYSLKTYDEVEDKGRAFGSCNGFMVDLPHRRSFCPDAGYYLGPQGGWDFFQGAPVFAAEVRNEEDYGPAAEREMAAKRADYFAAGKLVVWDVDLLSEEVVAFTATAMPNIPPPPTGAGKWQRPNRRSQVGRCRWTRCLRKRSEGGRECGEFVHLMPSVRCCLPRTNPAALATDDCRATVPVANTIDAPPSLHPPSASR